MRASLAFYAVAGASYSLSVWNLSEVARSIVNMQTAPPAIVYPFFTGLRFIPTFVFVLGCWIVVGARGDKGFVTSTERCTYWLVAAAMMALTITGVLLSYGDYEIWTSGLSERGIIAGCYA